MDMQFMRGIDHYMGVFLCRLLSFFRVRRGQALQPAAVRKILIVKFLGIGSIILTAPSVIALRERYPQARLYYLTFSSNRQILELLDLADERLYVDTSSFVRFVRSALAVIRRLRRERIDLAFDFEFFSKLPLVMMQLAGVRAIAGFALVFEPWRRRLLEYAGYYNHYYHIKDIFLSLVYLASEGDPYYVRFDTYRARYGLPRRTPHRKDTDSLEAVLRAASVPEGVPIILLNPNAGEELAPHLRRWPPERFSELARRLLARKDLPTMVWIGSADERPYVQTIIDMVDTSHFSQVRSVNLAGKTTLAELHALCATAALLVSVDSGPMHLAALTETPTIGLFGAETPTLYRPLNARAVALCKQLYSVPMFTVYNGKQSALTENIPVRSIEVDEVFEYANACLDGSPVWNAYSAALAHL